ncbi:BnaA08g06060D [Brassica napus]|uniref:BnaA08g06060D protein n=1 Tax=Brassica napus TaxID=3708 RepID=A0A078GBL7_BRANA|nr:BnaA08g06060D [Brassica napus]
MDKSGGRKPPVSELYKLCLGKLTSRWLMGQDLRQATWVHLLRMLAARNIGFLIFRGESSKSLDALVKNTGKESLQWGLAAGLYSGITYGMKEARGGAHDWRNSAVAGALTGGAMAMTPSESTSHEQVVQSALTGAAISTAANLLSSVF